MKFVVFCLQFINSLEGVGMFFSSAALIRRLRSYAETDTKFADWIGQLRIFHGAELEWILLSAIMLLNFARGFFFKFVTEQQKYNVPRAAKVSEFKLKGPKTYDDSQKSIIFET